MDATTLYIIVQLANGDVRTALEWPSDRGCSAAAQGMHHSRIANAHLSAGAKSVMFYCAPPPPESRSLRLQTLLFLRTEPGGKPIIEDSMPVRAEECHQSKPWQSTYSNDRLRAVCVRQAAWIVRPRMWRLVGNKIVARYSRDGYAVRLSGSR